MDLQREGGGKEEEDQKDMILEGQRKREKEIDDLKGESRSIENMYQEFRKTYNDTDQFMRLSD